MLYLFISILFSTSVALILKYSETRRCSRLVVTTSNYVIAFSVSLFFVLRDDMFSSMYNPALFFDSLFPVLLSSSGTFDMNGSFFWAVLAGIPGGICYFLGFIFIQKSIRENGVGITGAFSKMGIFIPMTLSILFWKEIPEPLQWVGIILAVAAVVSAHYTENVKKSLSSIKKSLVLVLLVVGFAEFSNKVFQHYADTAFKALFLFSVFFTAFLISLAVTIRAGDKPARSDLLVGALVGIPNMFTSFFLIHALRDIKAAVAFPLYSAVTIVFITLGGVLLFKETITRRDITAIALTILAVVFMNLD